MARKVFPSRRATEEYKKDIVRMFLKKDEQVTITRFAAIHKLSTATIVTWVKQYKDQL